ncbi:MAG: YegS/Rv2252/BmrU family lipid kinase [Lachnospiraceae bacterium]|nr:YegS/Rv2252/BmrU family lipid kinase [Lachnospiraceae bacterium]
MKKLLFILNPHSGKGHVKGRLFGIIDIMVKAGYEVTAYPTQCRDDAQRKVREEAGDFDLVVCSGGDGTLDEVVTGMMQRQDRVPIGYIPAGSTNDFANSLKIPKDMLKAAAVAVQGRRFPVDVGDFNQDSFIYVAAFGLFTAVSYQTSQSLKNVLGHAAYILEGARSLLDIPTYQMRVEHDDEVIEGEFIYGMISNSISVGGFKNLTGKHVLLDDGVFEVTLIKAPKNPIEMNEIIINLTNRKDNSDLIYTFKTDELRICPETTIPWTLDGEFGGEHRDVVIKNMHQAVEIMVKNKENLVTFHTK